ncbi:MAG TPA: hypothetical protein VLR72_00845 [Clostridiaceae bacterium]|nr:hypothetical protein [Clostridiaceae bacterium]
MKGEINELATSKMKMEQELSGITGECMEKDSEIEKLQEQISKMSDQHDEMKGLIAEAGQEISRLMDVEASNEEERNLFKMKIAEFEKETELQELKQEKARALSDEITGFKDDVFSIYKKIENIAGEQAKINEEIQLKLDDQITANSELKQQLDDERLRATKAENDQAAYVRCICELKESLFREQEHLETQLSQIADRSDDVNGGLMSQKEIL